MSDPLNLRAAQAGDVSQIRALVNEAYAKWLPLLGREPLPMVADYNEAVKNHRIDVLHLDGKLAALIEMIPANNHIWIENIAVATRYQGLGIGQKLMAHAEQAALTLGQSEVRLSTNKLFTENILLYEKLGFRTFREEPYKGGAIIYMSKCLQEDTELKPVPVSSVKQDPPSS